MTEETQEIRKISAFKNLKIIKPANWFSFGFILILSFLIIIYGIFFGFSDARIKTDTIVDAFPSRPFEPGLSASDEHQALMNEHYEEKRKMAEESGVTAVPPIPFEDQSESKTNELPDEKLADNILSPASDEIPFPDDPEPPMINLNELKSDTLLWEPPSDELSYNQEDSLKTQSDNDEYNQSVENNVTAIAKLISLLDTDAGIGHQPQAGSYWSSGQVDSKDSLSTKKTNNNESAVIPATSRFMCRTTHAINNKRSTVSFVEAECLSGVMKGGKIQGNFTVSEESLPLEFTSFHKDGYTVAIKGYAIDPNTQVIGLATDVDKHTLSRHLALVSSSFLEGIGSLMDNTRISINNDTVISEARYDTNDRLVEGVNKVGSRYAEKAEAYFDIDPTITIRKHQPFILMVVEDVSSDTFPAGLARR